MDGFVFAPTGWNHYLSCSRLRIICNHILKGLKVPINIILFLNIEFRYFYGSYLHQSFLNILGVGSRGSSGTRMKTMHPKNCKVLQKIWINYNIVCTMMNNIIWISLLPQHSCNLKQASFAVIPSNHARSCSTAAKYLVKLYLLMPEESSTLSYLFFPLAKSLATTSKARLDAESSLLLDLFQVP